MDIKALVPILVHTSLVLIVVSAGLKSDWRDLECALKRPGLLLRGIVAVNVVVPLAAIVLVLILPIDPPVKLGIVIMAVSPLAPLVPGRMLKVGANASVAVGLYFALILLAVIIVPATVALLSAIFPPDAVAPISSIATLVLTSVLAPLLGGIMIASFVPRHAALLSTIAAAVGNGILILFVIAVLYVAGGALVALAENGTILACAVAVAAGLAGGHMLGGPEPENRIALAIAAATRHPGIAALIVRSATDDRRVILTVILFLLVSVVVSGIYQAWAMRRLARENVITPPLHPEARRW